MCYLRLVQALAACLLAAACAPMPNLPPVQPYDAATLAATRYKAVLVAGDGHLPVFDNAVEGMASRLREDGLSVADVQRLSAAPAVVAQEGMRSATLDHVLSAVRDMRPGLGEGCLVYATSHGAPFRGLSLATSGEMLTPNALDRALAQGCGNAPTVVVISGCFSGTFAQAPMTRENRVVLTAARADRASFGCGAGRTYTIYDRCLLDAMNAGGSWQDLQGSVQGCVTAEELKGRFTPSQPQAWFGSAVANLPRPGRTTTSAKAGTL